MLRNIRPIPSFILVVLTTCIGCAVSEFDSAESLNAYVASPANNLSQNAESSGYRIAVTYRPTDLLVYQEVESESFDSARVSSLRKKYSGYYYFIVSLSKGDKEALEPVGGGASQYSELVQTLSFRMGSYVTLTTSEKDTIPVGDFILNRTYGLSQSTDLLFVFNREEAKEKEWVQFNLNEFGLGVGNQRFRFLREDLDEIPQINFKKLSGTSD